jgi:hypothetical protein
LVLVSIVIGPALFGSPAIAIEPDGRVAFRLTWPEVKEGDAPRLRLTMTAVTDLADARLVAKIPDGIGLDVRGEHGVVPMPSQGVEIGALAAGRTFIVEFDVDKPIRGGEIVSFTLEATADGRAVSEGVGVPVGVPGTEPTLRNGAVEFPASSPDPKP